MPSAVTAAGEALQKPPEEEKARSPTAKPRPPMLQRSWSSEAGQERRASLTNSGGQLVRPGEVKKSSSMGHAVVTALLRQVNGAVIVAMNHGSVGGVCLPATSHVTDYGIW